MVTQIEVHNRNRRTKGNGTLDMYVLLAVAVRCCECCPPTAVVAAAQAVITPKDDVVVVVSVELLEAGCPVATSSPLILRLLLFNSRPSSFESNVISTSLTHWFGSITVEVKFVVVVVAKS